MKRLLGLALVVCAFLPGMANAQNAALMPVPKMQFLDANGMPLSGGLLYTCVAGASCAPSFAGDPPLTPLATYTDSTAGTPNPNPIILDSAGRAGVWLGAGSYKLVLQDATGAAVWTQDNVSSTSLKAVTATTGAVSNFNVPGALTAGSATIGTLGVAGSVTTPTLTVGTGAAVRKVTYAPLYGGLEIDGTPGIGSIGSYENPQTLLGSGANGSLWMNTDGSYIRMTDNQHYVYVQAGGGICADGSETAWVSGTNYQPGNEVSYGGSSYVSLDMAGNSTTIPPNIGHRPDLDTTHQYWAGPVVSCGTYGSNPFRRTGDIVLNWPYFPGSNSGSLMAMTGTDWAAAYSSGRCLIAANSWGQVVQAPKDYASITSPRFLVNFGLGTPGLPSAQLYSSGANPQLLLESPGGVSLHMWSDSVNAAARNFVLQTAQVEIGDFAVIQGNSQGANPATTGTVRLRVTADGHTSIMGGTNILYRCTVAGTLRLGQTTTVAADCGTAVDTGLKVN